jgi:hypothetical protein
MSGSTEGFGGGAGGVNAAIPLAAGRFGQQQGNGLANNPLAFIDAMTHMQQFRQQQQLFPGQLELQQQGIQQGGLGIQKSQAELNALRNNQVATGMMPLFQKGDALTLADATNTLGQLHAAGYNTDALTAMIAKSGQTGGRGLADVIRSAVTQAHPTLGVPNMQQVNLGNRVMMQDVNPFTNPDIAKTQYTPGFSPTEAAQKVEWIDNKGVMQQGTMQEWSRQRGLGIAGPGQPTPVGAGGSNPLLGSMAPGPNGQPDLVGRPSPNTVAGPLPGVVTAAEATGTSSSARFQAISDQAVQARTQAGLLGNIQSEVENYTPGTGADVIKDFKSILMRLNILNPEGVKSLAAQESVDKIANQLADALGAGSDARLHVQQGANPSSHNTPEGLKLILNQLLGSADYLQARGHLAAMVPATGDIRKFEDEVGSKLDPRVFQYDRLTGPQAQEYVKGIKDTPRFMRAYKWAEDHNLLASQQ